MSTVILNVCTVPSVDAGRAIYNLGDLSDDGVYKAMMHLQHQKNGTEFLPLNQHQIVAISVVILEGDKVSTHALGDEHTSEAGLLQQLAELLKNGPDIVCWNGSELDLPVIGYRLLKHGIACPAFWERDSFEESSVQTLDLMHELSAYSPGATASLSEMAQVLGLAGHLGLESLDILEQYQEGNVAVLRQASEIDVLNTYLIYLKLQKTKGALSGEVYDALNTQLKQQLVACEETHLRQFAATCRAEQ